MTDPADDQRTRPLLGALAGLLAALAALAAAELAAVLVRPQASPVVAVGGSVIDATPVWLKEFAIRKFGTNDKPVLIGSILVVLVLLSLVTGALAVRSALGRPGRRRRARSGRAAAAATRPAAEALDPLPSLLGAVVGAWRDRACCARQRLAGRHHRLVASPLAGDRRSGSPLLRSPLARVGRLVNSSRGDIGAARAAVELPAPSSSASPLPRRHRPEDRRS